MAPPAATATVAGTRSHRYSETETLYLNETPRQGQSHSTDRLPSEMVRECTRPLMYSTYCWGAGRSRPIWWWICSSFAGVQRFSGQYW